MKMELPNGNFTNCDDEQIATALGTFLCQRHQPRLFLTYFSLASLFLSFLFSPFSFLFSLFSFLLSRFSLFLSPLLFLFLCGFLSLLSSPLPLSLSFSLLPSYLFSSSSLFSPLLSLLFFFSVLHPSSFSYFFSSFAYAAIFSFLYRLSAPLSLLSSPFVPSHLLSTRLLFPHTQYSPLRRELIPPVFVSFFFSGYAAHLVLMISKYQQLPLRYKITPLCSRAVISDEISEIPPSKAGRRYVPLALTAQSGRKENSGSLFLLGPSSFAFLLFGYRL